MRAPCGGSLQRLTAELSARLGEDRDRVRMREREREKERERERE